MNSSSRTLLLSLIALSVALAGCGKKDTMAANSAADTSATTSATTADTSSSSNTTATATNASAATPAAAGTASMTPAAASDTQGRAIEIDANDTMKFSVNEIKAKPGESITVTLKNTGTLPKTAMGHNFVLLKSADAVQPFVTDSTQAGATDYIPESQKASIIAHTKLLGPGESDSVTFKAPDTAGSYPYLCSFPGHYQVGMKGELVVQ